MFQSNEIKKKETHVLCSVLYFLKSVVLEKNYTK
jgi:hypothetical protein